MLCAKKRQLPPNESHAQPFRRQSLRMNQVSDIKALVGAFLAEYDAENKDRIWRGLSERFRSFWASKVMAADNQPISEADCDEVIRILDRNGKGNTKDTEAVARAMIPQGAWRRMLNELHTNKTLVACSIVRCLIRHPKRRQPPLISCIARMLVSAITSPVQAATPSARSLQLTTQ